MASLETTIGSIKLKTPLMPASGTFGYGDEYYGLISYEVLGAIVTKSLSLNPKRGNPPPRIHELPYGILNSIGLENIGLERFLKEKLPFLEKLDLPIVVSIFGESEEEFLQVGKRLKNPPICALEVNLSCPNVKEGGMLFGSSPERVHRIVSLLKNTTPLPLWVKLPPDPFHLREIVEAAEKGGADALTLVNTLPAMMINPHTGKPLLGGITGGLSGQALFPVALRMVYEAYKYTHLPIIGSGGIYSGEEAISFIMAGASAIQIGSAIFSNPHVFSEIHNYLIEFLKKKNLTDINMLKGKIHDMENSSL
jgi:dihydroorotate dehydrogenase (NAD+) catalytic subunit